MCREIRTPELIDQIRNFIRMSIDTISAQFDVSVGTVPTIIHEELKMQKIAQSLSQGWSKKIRMKYFVMTAGRWSS